MTGCQNPPVFSLCISSFWLRWRISFSWRSQEPSPSEYSRILTFVLFLCNQHLWHILGIESLLFSFFLSFNLLCSLVFLFFPIFPKPFKKYIDFGLNPWQSWLLHRAVGSLNLQASWHMQGLPRNLCQHGSQWGLSWRACDYAAETRAESLSSLPKPFWVAFFGCSSACYSGSFGSWWMLVSALDGSSCSQHRVTPTAACFHA